VSAYYTDPDPDPYRDTVTRRALAEVCTILLLLVYDMFSLHTNRKAYLDCVPILTVLSKFKDLSGSQSQRPIQKKVAIAEMV